MDKARKKLADCMSLFIQNEWKPLIKKTGVSFICSVDGVLHLFAENDDELKKEIVNLLRGLIESGIVDKVDIAKLLSKAETSWWEHKL